MFGLLALAFIAIPILEIWLIFQVGGALGAPATLGLIVATAVAGAALARRQGFAAVAKLQTAAQTGHEVGLSAVEAALVLAAAIMLLLPGFATDAFGLALLLPPLRRPVARTLLKRARASMSHSFAVNAAGGPYDSRDESAPPGVIDV